MVKGSENRWQIQGYNPLWAASGDSVLLHTALFLGLEAESWPLCLSSENTISCCCHLPGLATARPWGQPFA